MEKIISVIDLGTTKVVCLAGKKTAEGYKVIASCESPSQGIMRGEVVNNQSVLNTLKPLLVELETRIGEPILEVEVGIAGRYIRCKSVSSNINRPDPNEVISEQEINNMWRNMYNSRVDPGEEVLHVVPQSYHVDDYRSVPDPVGMYGSCIEANYKLFIGKSVSAEHTKRTIEGTELKLNRLVLEPLATARAVLQEDEKELGVAMVDIGGGTTDLLVYQDNIIRHTAVIPFGGNVITEDIRQGCEVTVRQAEQMKIQYGSCYADLAPENKAIVIAGIGGRESREIPFRFLANIIEARMDEILDAVMYEINQSGYGNRLPAGIVLTGGGSLLFNLPQFIKFKTGYDARVARPHGIITEGCEEVNQVTYSCAAGLLMYGFENQGHFPEEKQADLTEIFAGVNAGQTSKTKKTVKKVSPGKKPKEKTSIGNLLNSIFDVSNEA
ncbi:MAG TPA: cell division protein FtsA [Bacteroidales bacterium]|jgi:cell division protein FtsA|nr:cell division protein FtsA [Bacteroidales bacterium]MCZ2416402.1 cell division protein FtsA [Burkholderiales bacterium]OQC58523.1 MAG: Cell division protein FtsA [Bacteroidetes bacterium ADurb.Bin013]MBP8999569.1 cell division protein FtsA [Bacteroidales bacterium]MBV6455216.1 Cell division protein FtsA [Bacteroidales bacterium]